MTDDVTADDHRAAALLATPTQTAPPAGDRAPNRAAAKSDPKNGDSVAASRNTPWRLPLCGRCRQPLDHDSYAYVDVQAAWKRQQEHAAWSRRRIKYGHPIVPPPDRVNWRWTHSECHRDPDFARLYVVPVGKLRSDRRVLELVLRLSREKWAAHTNWQTTLVRPILDAK
jgi:hypothetical protein